MAIQLSQAQINAAAGGGNALRETLSAMRDEISAINTHVGRSMLRKVDVNLPTQVATPPVAQFAVTGEHGVYHVAITNPQNQTSIIPGQVGTVQNQNSPNSTLYHEISSSPVPDFSSGVTVYPITSNTHTNISLPGVTLYWRLRSSYDGSTWNAYSVLNAAVYSNLVGSDITTPNVPLNQTNFATVDSVAAGGTASVRVYGPGGLGTGYTRQVGTHTIPRPSGTIVGLPYGADKFVAYDGTQFQVTNTLATVLPDTWEPVGKVSIIANGGGLVLPVIHGVVVSGSIVGYQIINPGNGLTAPPILTITDATGSGATATCQISAGQVTQVTPGNVGTLYSSTPTVTPSGGVSAGNAGGGGAVGGNGGRLTNV
ncbi:MAG: hypothetical protein ACJ71S_06650 [Acidobacteriaceae bacterium]|jgi:hypothetical protein